MTALSFEEKGLLRILGRIGEGEAELEPAVLFALSRRGLIDLDGALRLSAHGQHLLAELRERSERHLRQVSTAA